MLPPGHESAFNEDVLQVEEEEFRLADRLLCPSDFVVETFRERGFEPEKLARHIYGYDEKTYYPGVGDKPERKGLNMLFVGVCAVRKGVHRPRSLAEFSREPRRNFQHCGRIPARLPTKTQTHAVSPKCAGYGHRNDVPELMRNSDILVQSGRGIWPRLHRGYGQRVRSRWFPMPAPTFASTWKTQWFITWGMCTR